MQPAQWRFRLYLKTNKATFLSVACVPEYVLYLKDILGFFLLMVLLGVRFVFKYIGNVDSFGLPIPLLIWMYNFSDQYAKTFFGFMKLYCLELVPSDHMIF